MDTNKLQGLKKSAYEVSDFKKTDFFANRPENLHRSWQFCCLLDQDVKKSAKCKLLCGKSKEKSWAKVHPRGAQFFKSSV
jgi:hypothetical protein